MATRRCSECPNPLTHPAAKTCGRSCRDKRARRIKAQHKRAGRARVTPGHLAPLQEAAAGKVDDVLHDVAKDELRPIVREAITEDVLRSIQRLVSLTGTMVDAIESDMTSQDAVVRQRAYTLVARYTLGNSSVAPAPTDPAQQPLQVILSLPRPDDPVPATLEASAHEMRKCSECHVEKPNTDFVEGGFDRCLVCHDAFMKQVNDRFGH